VDIGLLTATDPVILQAAAKEERVLLTADSDFGALLALGSLASPSVLLLRSADHLRPNEQAELMAANLPHRRRPGEGSDREPRERSPACS
jgi:predicted nuclease of predicted toxin-antitoxin system